MSQPPTPDGAGAPPGSTADASADHRYRNRLLRMLPEAELALLEPWLERVPMARRQLMYDAERPIEFVYFVERGIVSILSVLADGSAVETATIGVDGFIGLPAFHGVETPAEQAMTQVPGDALRMPAAAFQAALSACPVLHRTLHRFSAFLFTLAAQNSACNRKHAVEQRCARWLLTVRDRMERDDIGLTHDFISQMLGVRRASVTDTLSALEARGLVAVGRGNVTITDRPGLEALVCECYAISAGFYERAMTGAPVRTPLSTLETSRDGFSVVGDGTPIARSLDEPTLDDGDRG